MTTRIEIDLTKLIEELTDTEKVKLVELICQYVELKGTIGKIRKVINSPSYDD